MNAIDVIIPTYNRAKYLVQAVDSVLAQTYQNIKIWVTDDGSTDNTAELMQKYDSRVSVVSQPNHGVSHARNRAIELGTNPWIALLDSDDLWHPNKLQSQMDTVLLNKARWCHSNEIWLRNGRRVNSKKKHTKPSGRIYKDCLPLCCVSPSSVLLSRSLIEEYGAFDESLPVCEDYDLWLRLAAHEPIILVEDALVVKLGGHADQLSQQYWGMDRFRVKALQKQLDGRLGITDEEYAMTLNTFKFKCTILSQGACKRGKYELMEYYSSLAISYD